jgi:polyhydroxyalkanoate synthesis regulator phasin
MTNIKSLQAQAEEAKALYKIGSITREEAQKKIDPYINAFNAKSEELAKKFNQKVKRISLVTYLRSR